MNKKGFTLIELLAVIVILAILMLVASTNVFNILDNARRGSFRTEFLALLQSAQTTASMDMMDGTLSQTNNSICYKIGDSKFNQNFDNKNNYKGSVLVTLQSDGSLVLKGWLSGNYFTIKDKGEGIQNNSDDIPATTTADENDTKISNCGK